MTRLNCGWLGQLGQLFGTNTILVPRATRLNLAKNRRALETRIMYEHMISAVYLSWIKFFGKSLSANNDTRKQKLSNDCGKTPSNIEVSKIQS